jgi:hypothetical protein
MSILRSVVLGSALCVLAATSASGQGSTGSTRSTDKQERSPVPKHDSGQQREDSLKAERARKSGEKAIQPSSPNMSDQTRTPPTNQSGSTTQSSSTNQVQGIQAALKAQGHDPGPIDGVMGRRTQDALRAYQLAQHLKPTGQVDRETLDKLGVGRATRQP